MTEAPATVSSALVADFLACRHKAALALAETDTQDTTEPHDDADLGGADPTRELVFAADAALQQELTEGRLPATVHISSIFGPARAVATRDLEAFARRARARAESFAADPPPTIARPCDHCRWCPHRDRCQAEWTERDDVSLVAGSFGRVVEQLAAHGIHTATQLADAPPDPPPDLDARRFRTLQRQARLQIAARSGPDRYEVLPPDEHPGGGFSLLPPPDDGDLFFDLEGDPHRGNGGLEYLWGISDVHDTYQSWWGHTPSEERAAFETVVDLLTDHLARHPGAHVYHYAPYETEVLRRLALRHASREDQLQRLVDDRRLVDLYRIVRQTVATSRPGYGMKQLEHFYRNGRQTDVQDGLASVVAYEAWLTSGNQTLLDDIQAYNRDDCVSTRQLRDWLEERRAEVITTHGPPEFSAPVPSRAAAPPRTNRAAQLAQRLRAGLPDALDQRDDTQRRNDLLLQLLEWHRREDRRRPPPDPAADANRSAELDAEVTRRAAAVVDTVDAVLSGDDRGRAFDAVLRRTPSLPPEVLQQRSDETAADVVVRAALALDDGALAVQAPPGTGFSATLDRLIAALTEDGRTVGLCAVDAAAERQVDADTPTRPGVTVGSLSDFVDDRPSVSFDVLILVGAGRAGLADLAAIARRASNLVLCGDPGGMDRPRMRGRHPAALRQSVLAHLLDDGATIPPHLGVLLDEAAELHPGICRVVSDIAYDGRLRSAVDSAGPDRPDRPMGLGWVPVEHAGRTTACPEEVQAVTDVVASLAPDGGPGDDVLVVTPFGDHARLLADALPESCRVGTLDQTHHETARVVVYSLACSSPDAIPGGRNQVFSRHRLAAALSCARELAVVVGNPSLLDARCRSPRHVAQLNALIRVVGAGRTMQIRAPDHTSPQR